MAEKKNDYVNQKAVTAVKKDESKPGFFKRIGKWFREMKSELKKVIWPTKKELGNNTLISVGMMLLSALVVWGFDQIAQMLVKALLAIAG
jgi:preprotein translocase, SecE subunit, bacterial